MKKIIIIFAALLPFLASCSKEAMFYGEELSFYGSSYHGDGVARSYMTGLVSNFVIDNLLAIEDALLMDNLGRITAREGSSFKPDGQSLWTVGATWEVNSVQSIRGVKIVREAADSTWKMTYDGEYDLYGASFTTRSSMTVKMLPGGYNDHYDWQIDLALKRTEDEGYASDISNIDVVRFMRTTSSSYSWGACFGQFMMEVTRNGAIVEGALLTYNGNSDDFRYRGGL